MHSYRETNHRTSHYLRRKMWASSLHKHTYSYRHIPLAISIAQVITWSISISSLSALDKYSYSDPLLAYSTIQTHKPYTYHHTCQLNVVELIYTVDDSFIFWTTTFWGQWDIFMFFLSLLCYSKTVMLWNIITIQNNFFPFKYIF